MRTLPFFKPKNKPQFAGLNVSDTSSGGGGGGGDTSSLVNKSDITAIILTGTTNTLGDIISAGTWFYLNGTPCIAKVDIASGATFTEGTNYEEKTIGSALSELNSNMAQFEKIAPSYEVLSTSKQPLYKGTSALIVYSAYNGDHTNQQGLYIVSRGVDIETVVDEIYYNGISEYKPTLSLDSQYHITVFSHVMVSYLKIYYNF